MKPLFLLPLSFFLPALVAPEAGRTAWLTEEHAAYSIRYTEPDQRDLADYRLFFEEGIRSVRQFFGDTFRKKFTVNVHPDRASLDAQWQQDWGMPDFHSECWMVASGVAGKLDLVAPKAWDREACEHRYADSVATQQLITHELVHVFHGQQNGSPDFSATEGIDWFVEGLATYASGQCDSARIAQVQRLVRDNKAPGTLDDFWKGNARYGLSGTLVQYIDLTYGRAKLKQLLPLTKKSEVLGTLSVSEEMLLAGWKKFLLSTENR